MNRTQHRFVSILATGAAALAFGAAPALAGTDGCVGGDCQDENTPAPVVPVAPAPVAPQAAPAPTSSGGGGGGGASEGSSKGSGAEKGSTQSRATKTRNVTVAQRTVAQRTVPQGAVSAGAGGMAVAPGGDSDGALFGLAGAGLVLLAAGGRLVAVGRRTGS